jgi:hypothetical protein
MMSEKVSLEKMEISVAKCMDVFVKEQDAKSWIKLKNARTWNELSGLDFPTHFVIMEKKFWGVGNGFLRNTKNIEGDYYLWVLKIMKTRYIQNRIHLIFP